jgi:hypothetical protein
VGSDQLGQPLGVDLTGGQRGIHAAPAAPVGGQQAQMRQRRHRLCRQQRVDQLEQRIPAPTQTSVQLAAEALQARGDQALVNPIGQRQTVHHGHRRRFEASQLRSIQRWPPSRQTRIAGQAVRRGPGLKGELRKSLVA